MSSTDEPDYRSPQVPTVDEVAANERADRLATRSIKTEAKVQGLRMLITMLDLTTLEGADTPGKVRSLCQKALTPAPRSDQDYPSVGAVCVYPPMVEIAREQVAGTDVNVASVASYFPSGQAALEERVEEVKRVRDAGADEIDVVMNRNAFLSGRYERVHEEIRELVLLRATPISRSFWRRESLRPTTPFVWRVRLRSTRAPISSKPPRGK
jgi:deoxyribose-phosphate aldolase